MTRRFRKVACLALPITAVIGVLSCFVATYAYSILVIKYTGDHIFTQSVLDRGSVIGELCHNKVKLNTTAPRATLDNKSLCALLCTVYVCPPTSTAYYAQHVLCYSSYTVFAWFPAGTAFTECLRGYFNILVYDITLVPHLIHNALLFGGIVYVYVLCMIASIHKVMNIVMSIYRTFSSLTALGIYLIAAIFITLVLTFPIIWA